ncbi:fumarylacetoacetase [Domibacillus sp. DTU_2020_1001157_1_SI_ALB_TIR_016]|uniref:fumarylacetoacetase n=1 Tax=Domibacillus sp. DTU_2020_1001157_1_SI_ALB_TIR_016 TaxID=3077789 RepID=UPI0028ECFA1B|nr:fumarylacetoacetase [Domibacillus sp. DTU_2020_1001157_1_SI_ALB_TIR_016]WNS78567.1 fumarylacetoacetase [Domibacillus sp. DTU_2020_1001157_1_SI_ALB_TIR_016]
MNYSFIETIPDSHFPIQNLPYGIFQPIGKEPRAGTAIGDYVLDLSVMDEAGFLNGTGAEGKDIFSSSSLNQFMALGRPVWSAVRKKLQYLLDADTPDLRDNEEIRSQAFYLMRDVEMLLPANIGDYTDFYASREHATNVGTMFRGKDHALMPNWTHLPIGYHGRASSIVPSGTAVRRPLGQRKPPNEENPVFGPSVQLDFELEMGWFIGSGNRLGEPIPVNQAENHVFGLVLVNDWSARDIQAWEYQPLGPFLAKNFATSISPWVVPLEALEPFRASGPEQEPKPFPYLQQAKDGAFNINLEVHLQPENTEEATKITNTNFSYMYWSIAQQVAHHTITGCNIRPGDMHASGTISGPERAERGSLLELSWRGAEPVQLNGGGQRSWIEDGDQLTITGWCQGDGYRIGFGSVTGKVLPALSEAEILNAENVKV